MPADAALSRAGSGPAVTPAGAAVVDTPAPPFVLVDWKVGGSDAWPKLTTCMLAGTSWLQTS